jgi:sugar lactone lactonase YvrE
VGGDPFDQAESPRWDARSGRLLWVDMCRGDLHVGRFEGGSVVSDRVVSLGASVGFAAPIEAIGEADAPGWVCAAGRDLVHVSEQGAVRVIADEVADPGTQFNDGACDPSGVLWAGTQSHTRVPDAGLFTLGQDGTVRRRLGEVTVSNGLGFTDDGRRMYYIDTLPHRQLEVFDLADGELTSRRTLATIDGGNPDGLAVDRDGGVWVAVWDAGEVRHFDRHGRQTRVVEVAARRPSAVCLVDDVLLVTTARIGLADPRPEDGRFFAAHVDVPGAPVNAWRPDASVLAASTAEAPTSASAETA